MMTNTGIKMNIDFSRLPKHVRFLGEELIYFTVETLLIWESFSVEQAVSFLEKREEEPIQSWLMYFDYSLFDKYQNALDKWNESDVSSYEIDMEFGTFDKFRPEVMINKNN